jgi:pilus assembly protein CpaF
VHVLVNDILRNQQWVAYDSLAGFTIGREDTNQVALKKSPFISAKHLTVDRGPDGWELMVDPQAMAVTVDDVEIQPGQSVALKPVSHVTLPGFSLMLTQAKSVEPEDPELTRRGDLNKIQRDIHQAVLERMELRHEGARVIDASEETLLTISMRVDEIIRNDFKAELGADGSQRDVMLALALSSRLQRWLGGGSRHVGSYEVPGKNAVLEKLAGEYDTWLGPRLNLQRGDEGSSKKLMQLDANLREMISVISGEMPENVQFYMISRHLKKVVCDMIFGFGPLQDLLEMPGVSEIMIVSPTQVYIEQDGFIMESNCTFLGDEALLSVIERIVAPLGRRIDRSNPLVDARLPDGSRVNAIIPPLALKGPCVTIRRFQSEGVTPAQLLSWGAISVEALEMLRGIVSGRKSIVVAGGTGSGKTTMLNVLSGFINSDERVVTIEDSAELQLQQKHVVSLETRPANVEGTGAITIRDLIKNSLRMRPDRIIVGECRGSEAFDMLQAMNTGHNGSMTTVHANSPQDVMTRLESMCLMAVDIPLQAVRQQISQAIDLVVYLERMPNHQRMTTAIAEVAGIDPRTGQIITRSIMKANYRQSDGKYYLEHNGYIPSFLPELVGRDLMDIERVFFGSDDDEFGDREAADGNS